MPKLITPLVFLALFLILTKQVLAVFEFSTNNNQIADAEELEVTLNLDLSTSTSDKTYFLRGAFFKGGTTKYFGYTINNSGNPYNGPYSNCQELPSAHVDQNGDWTGSVKVKIDPESSYFEGSGDYLFKIGRYTESCSSVTWADSSPITIAVTQTIFPSPSPTQTLQKSSPPTPTSSSLKSTVTPKSSPKTSPMPKTILGEKVESHEIIASNSALEINSQSPFPSPVLVENQKTQNSKLPLMVAGAGIILIGLSAIFYLWTRRNLNKAEKEDEKTDSI